MSNGYVYKPSSEINEDYNPDTVLEQFDTVPASTTLEELDRMPPPTIEVPVNNSLEPRILTTVPQGGTYSRLQQLTDEANKLEEQKQESKKLLNLPVKDFIGKISFSWIETINDIISLIFGTYQSSGGIIDILTKDDRILSIGILLVFLSVFLMAIQNLY